MENIKIALLQIPPCTHSALNALKGEEACRKAASLGADIALFPEMWSIGYNIFGRPEAEWTAEAAAAEEYEKVFSPLARELNMAIGVTLLEKRKGPPANSLLLFDCEGRLALRYSKVHTCDFGPEHALARGDDFPVCSLKTARGTVKTGCMICFDREFPESARILMLRGAELILCPNACVMEINRISQLRTRSFENMVAIATCNYPEGVCGCNGFSSLFDGMAWREEGDINAMLADRDDGIYIAELEIDALRAYRAAEVMGDAYRRPALYGDIAKDDPRPPFVRGDSRRK